MEIPLLVLAAFFAGFIDAIAGGGGLIQLPALMVILPGAAIPTIFGTNKFSSMFGTLLATFNYVRSGNLIIKPTFIGAFFAFIFSFLGARAVSYLDPKMLKPAIITLLVVSAAYTYWKKDFGKLQRARRSSTAESAISAMIGIVLGFYDGFFGPGMGSFLILAFVAILGFDFLKASTSAKIINLTTNLAAVIFFLWHGNIIYKLAIPMALSNICGSQVGSRMAILKGSVFVRKVFLVVVTALILKLVVS